MSFYPIFRRELNRAMRGRLIYGLRLGTVGIAVVIGIWLLKRGGTWQAGAAVGREIFNRVTWPAFILCLLSGVLLSSNLLCEERREGSLALLFLTPLKGVDVIIGKLGAIALLTSQIVLAVFPVTALCMVLGGVSAAEFARMIQVLMSTLALSLALGIAVSALNRSGGRAALITFFAIAGLTLGLAFADSQARRFLPPGPAGLLVPGPLQLFLTIPDLEFRLPPRSFDDALWWQCGVAVGVLLLAGSMLKRLSLSGETKRVLKSASRDYNSNWQARRRALRRNPIHWMVLRQRGRWAGTWGLFALLLALWIAFLQLFANEEWGEPIGFFLIGPIVHLLFKTVVISETSEFFAVTKRGELELLLVSSLSTMKIIHGHARALLRQLAWPAGMLFGADLFLVFFHTPRKIASPQSTMAYLFIFALGITLLVDLPALIWRGLWNGLRSNNALSAMRRTFLEVLVLPVPFFIAGAAVPVWLAAVFVAPILDAFGIRDLTDDAGTVTAGIVLWWLVSFVTNLFLQRNARQNLNTWLRYIAANGGAGARLVRKHFLSVPSHFPPYLRLSENR
jgi:ABC-type transport system involved in cytochrome c biogenesis permease component